MLRTTAKQLVALAAVTLLPHALAQVETQVTAKASPQLEPHTELRVSQVEDRVVEKDGRRHMKPFLHFRPMVGLKVKDPGFDLQVYGFFYKNTETTAMETTRPYEVYAFFDGVDLGPINISPYLGYYTPHGKDAGQTLVASVQSLSHEFATGMGSLTGTLGVEVGGYMATREETTTYQKRGNESLGLKESTVDGKKKDQDFYHIGSAVLGFKPSAVKGLKLSFENYSENFYKAQYTVDEKGAESSKYVMGDQDSYQLMRVAYALTERLTVRNDLYTFQDKFFAKRGATKDFRNEIQLIYKM